MKRLRICLVGATHPSQNPRLVREADTLMEAGHQVRVVTPCFVATLAERDAVLMQRRLWRLEQVDFRPLGAKRLRSAIIRGRRRLAGRLFSCFKNSSLPGHKYALAGPELLKLASREPAEWFIAHTQAALPVAAEAARRWNARLGFDCEDLLARSPGEPTDLFRAIERRYLPHCSYVSTASRGMAAQLMREYGVVPIVLYNVFPKDMASRLVAPDRRPIRPTVRLTWFGQTIGNDRGIQHAIQALMLLPGNCELHLRGIVAGSFRPELDVLAQHSSVASRLVIHPLANHDDLIEWVGQCDIGLALEQSERENASLTVSNKVFSYLLAGVAVAATDTAGQREILEQIPDVGFLCPSGDSTVLAQRLNVWIQDRSRLRAAQQAAWDEARARFCWDWEAEKFLRLFESALPQGAQAGKSVAR